MNAQEARNKALEMLETVRMPDPERCLHAYPFELSGGMRQRVMIALAMICRPDVLIADEPTTALDVTIQAQILGLLAELRRDANTSVVLITHDLAVAAGLCDRIMILYNGRLIESGTTRQVFSAPKHPYTVGLLASLPSLATDPATDLPAIPGQPPDAMAIPGRLRIRRTLPAGDGSLLERASGTGRDARAARSRLPPEYDVTGPLLNVEALCVDYERPRSGAFGSRARKLRAVNDISFELSEGETLGIVGETGCGKTSLGKAVLQLITPSAGRVVWRGVDLSRADAITMTRLRSELQIVFQDPLSALNPRMPVGEIVAEPLRVHSPRMPRAPEREAAVAAMFERVGLRPEMIRRYPNEFSSGQCQRISIARAMITEPETAGLRRTGQRARRFDTGADLQSASPPAARDRHRDTVHQPRSLGRALHVAPGDGAVSRQADGNRPARRAV